MWPIASPRMQALVIEAADRCNPAALFIHTDLPIQPRFIMHRPQFTTHAQSPVYQNSPIYQNNSAPMYESYVEGPSYSQPVYSNPQQSSFPSQPGMSMPSSSNVVQANGSAPQYSQSMPVAQASTSMNSGMPASVLERNGGQSVMNGSSQALVGQSANMQSMRPAMSGNAAAGQPAGGRPANGASQEQNAAQSALQMLASLGGQSEVGNQAAAGESSDADFALPQFTAARPHRSLCKVEHGRFRYPAIRPSSWF